MPRYRNGSQAQFGRFVFATVVLEECWTFLAYSRDLGKLVTTSLTDSEEEARSRAQAFFSMMTNSEYDGAIPELLWSELTNVTKALLSSDLSSLGLF